MYLSKMAINYISSMTMLTMEDIRNNSPEDTEIYSSVLNDYFSFLSYLRKDSNEFKYARYSWFVELRESFIFDGTCYDEIKVIVKNYFIQLYNYDYLEIPLVVKECFNYLDDEVMANKIYEEGNSLVASKLNLQEFEQSEEYQNAMFIFINKHKDVY